VIYLDTSYLVRLYLPDRGFAEVRALCQNQDIACCLHGRAEVLGALHRQFREGRLDARQFADLIDQFETDSVAGGFTWFPFHESLNQRLAKHYRSAPAATFLRAADAVHLACAAENGFTEVYSNDRHFLAAAPLFDLRGVNVIPTA
jgi:predicted nucleic acid-binding protein